MFDYLYFRFYKWQQRVGNGDIAAVSSLIALSISIIVYIYGILMMLVSLGWLQGISYLGTAFGAGTLCVMVLVLTYYVYLYLGRGMKIVKKYSQESEKQSQYGDLALILYVIVGILILFGSMYLKMLENENRF
ncbi:hypothetical protein GU926_11135 [Nibribacter ruber]|uniref:Uncharacterized protein n=1 Tax=Nibribacter ruber TaxID=2698458 RepID=A0A6P1P1N3_9BACT|nr:hypothetical protein [Nibribacter ruber]QHL87953.1 hypothetical protein GU926_11135 [Nibribacter ruber]